MNDVRANEENESKSGMLTFMPWVTVKTKTTLGDWELIPVELKAISKSHPEIYRILKCFKIHAKCDIHSATLIKKSNKQIQDVLTPEERDDCFFVGEIISFSSLSLRDFFSWKPYTNSASHLLFIQSFIENSPGFSVQSRRKDGSTHNYVPDEYHVVIQEPHVKNGDLEFDEQLASALIKAQSLPDWPSIHEGIFCYLKSNTDDSNAQVQTELMFSLGAFERLLKIPNGSCLDLASLFVQTLNLSLRELGKDETEERDFGKLSKLDSLREIWMRDFCICRGDMAHGRRQQSYKSIWSPQEHLLLAAEIFPILTKVVLSTHSLYSLTDDDLQRIYLFDKRLKIANLYKVGEDRGEPKFGWQEVRKQFVWTWAYDKKTLIPSTTSIKSDEKDNV